MPEKRNAGRGVLVAIAIAAVLALVVIVSVASGGGDQPMSETDSEASVSAPKDDGLQSCVDAWNASEGLGKDGGTLEVRNMRGVGDVYISIGPQEDYPDRCVLTISQPALDTASQYGGPVDGGEWAQVGRAPSSQLDDSLTDWNVDMDDTGTLTIVDP